MRTSTFFWFVFCLCSFFKEYSTDPNVAYSNEHTNLHDLPYDPGNIRRGWRTYRGNNYNNGNINNVLFTSNGNTIAYSKLLSGFPLTSGLLYSNKKDLIYTGTVEGQIIAMYAGCVGNGKYKYYFYPYSMSF